MSLGAIGAWLIWTPNSLSAFSTAPIMAAAVGRSQFSDALDTQWIER